MREQAGQDIADAIGELRAKLDALELLQSQKERKAEEEKEAAKLAERSRPTTDAEYGVTLDALHAALPVVTRLTGWWYKDMRGIGGAGDIVMRVREEAAKLATSLAAVAGIVDANRRRATTSPRS